MAIKKTFEQGMTLLELTVVLLVLMALAGMVVPYVAGTGQMSMCRATDATLLAVKRAIMGGPDGPGFYGDLLGQYPAGTKQYPLGNGNDFNLRYLFEKPTWAQKYNPKTAVGWREPYLQNGRMPPDGSIPSERLDDSFRPAVSFDRTNSSTWINKKIHESVVTTPPQPQIMDAWNRPIVLQIPCEKANASATICTLNYDYARLVSAGPGSGIKPSDGKIDTLIVYTSPAVPDASDRGDDRVLYLQRPDPYPQGNTPCQQD